MNKAKQKRLEARGWRGGTTSDFLGLSEEETALVEMKLRLGHALRERREACGLSQVALAKRLQSSQSRVAKWRRQTRLSRSIFCCVAWWRSAQPPVTSHGS